MNNFKPKNMLALLRNKKYIFVISILFLYFSCLSFFVCHAQSTLNLKEENLESTKTKDVKNMENAEVNTWVNLENGLDYIKIQKTWKEELPVNPDSLPSSLSSPSLNSSISSNDSSNSSYSHSSISPSSSPSVSPHSLSNFPSDFFKNPQIISQDTMTALRRENSDYLLTHEMITVSIDILKFDPDIFDFSVYSASWNNGVSKTLAQWSADKNIISAINASMFLPDGITSNGYLRKGLAFNNKREGTALGGFFVAGPKTVQNEEGIILPNAAIVYRNDTNFSRFTMTENPKLHCILGKYNVVVQNFKLLEIEELRLNDATSTIETLHNTNNLAKLTTNIMNTDFVNKIGTVNEVNTINKVNNKQPKETGETIDSQFSKNSKTSLSKSKWGSSRRHSIAAIAEDKDGNILFLHSQKPITVQHFICAIKNNSALNLRRALYTEGGGQASMSLTLDSANVYWFGQNNFLHLLMGTNKLPNIIGVLRK